MPGRSRLLYPWALMAFRLTPVVLLVALAASGGARAEANKDAGVDDCDDISLEVGVEAEVEAADDKDVVVPCAMADSGALGDGCADAAFYVVNQHGTLLCRVELAVFTNASSAPAVDTAPAAPVAGPSVSVVAAVVPLLPELPPPGGFKETSRLGEGDLLRAADAHLYDRPRPS